MFVYIQTYICIYISSELAPQDLRPATSSAARTAAMSWKGGRGHQWVGGGKGKKWGKGNHWGSGRDHWSGTGDQWGDGHGWRSTGSGDAWGEGHEEDWSADAAGGPKKETIENQGEVNFGEGASSLFNPPPRRIGDRGNHGHNNCKKKTVP